jgi:hypothetical protein
VPQRDADTLAEVVPDPERREDLLLQIGWKWGEGRRKELAEAGEQHVERLCRDDLRRAGRLDLAAAVRRVSVQSDQLGYDITTPTTFGFTRRLEVKTTARQGTIIRIDLTRNEVDTGLRDQHWCFVVCRRRGAADTEVVGWNTADLFRMELPDERSTWCRWQSVRIALRINKLIPGLPPLALPDENVTSG